MQFVINFPITFYITNLKGLIANEYNNSIDVWIEKIKQSNHIRNLILEDRQIFNKLNEFFAI